MIGEVFKGFGILHEGKNSMLVHKDIKAGEGIPKHNHPGYDIYFIVTKGKFNITLGDEEKYELSAGEALLFNGENTISATCDVDSESFVALAKVQ